MPERQSAIRCQDLTLGYNRHPAVHHLSGNFAHGSLTAIVGPNGAGKSTLLKGISGSLKPIGGHIELASHKRHNIAYLPQAADIDRSFPITVYDLVSMGLWNTIGFFRGISASGKNKIADALHAVGLTGFENRTIGTLSGGQMQRCLFARLILQDAPIILLDEPFNAIDAKTAHDLMHIIHHWHHEKRTIVAVLHDTELVKRAFPETLLIAREPIAWGETSAVLCSENMERSRSMTEAYDPHAHDCERAA
ncbi:zinc ABC transporter ATP-binding protein AztA [Microvirga sp. W0021]|uniref:Zinc ABC transporter ATP-binding protein AztA n=1 Tax=Hohaiivirga grylli TaxID=3133970 RepID=A0ABV0BJG6_9HYPH